MAQYDETSTLEVARERYFEAAGFAPGYEDRWGGLKVGPLPLAFPNAPGRRRAVRLHDLHHLATGYETSWQGEAEISAWEIASGCAHHLWAWYLNLGGLAIGLVRAPRLTWRAFLRGRHSTNLYQTEGEYHDGLLSRTVGELRRELALDRPAPRARSGDRLAFMLWSGVAGLYALSPVLGIALLVWLW
jgi:hypothetical protein